MAYRGYNPDTDIPNLDGKIFFLTGGTGGVGKTAVLELAKHIGNGHIYFTGRNATSAQAVISAASEITSGQQRVTFIECDQASLASLRSAAEKFKSLSDRLDVFIGNGGIMAHPPSLTKDGYELQFGTNHVGNAGLLLHLLPIMLRTAEQQGKNADVRFVAVTSLGYGGHPFVGIDFDGLRKPSPFSVMNDWICYSQSKLANILFAHELGRRYPSIRSSVIHPGVVSTELVSSLTFWKKVFVYVTNPSGLITPRQGCYNTVWAATAKDAQPVGEKNGKKVAFYVPVGKADSGDATCFNAALQKRLWEWTETEVGIVAPKV